MVKESVLLYGRITGGAQLRGGYAQNLPQAATDSPQPPRYNRGDSRVSFGKWLGSSTRLLSHQHQCWSDMLHNHLSGRSPLLAYAGGDRAAPVLGGEANLDYVKPHPFAFELLAQSNRDSKADCLRAAPGLPRSLESLLAAVELEPPPWL